MLQFLPQKRQLDVKFAVHDFIKIYFCYQLRQQRRLAMMTSKRSKWNNSLGEL